MADDIDELLDEVTSKNFYENETKVDVQQQVLSAKKSNGGAEELDAAIHSICSIPEPIDSIVPDVALNLNRGTNRKCTVVYVGDSTATGGLSGGVTQRRPTHRRSKHGATTKIYTKKYYTKPVFELSVKDLEAESARRKQKETIEKLFEKRMAVVTDKMILDVRKFKRIKSDVWSNFGDVRLLISEDEVKKLNIDHHVIHIGKEAVLLCKSFVACVKCSAVFSYESHSYGTSTLRSHLKSCGKQRYNRDKTKKRRLTGALSDVGVLDPSKMPEKPVFQQQMVKFRDHATKLQEQVLLFFINKIKPFSVLDNTEFKDLLQTFIQIGATVGDVNLTQYMCPPEDLEEYLVNDVYVQAEESFRNEIQLLYGLSFSASIWVDVNEKVSYITLSCHYANEDGLFKSVMFHTSEFPYDRKAPEDVTKLFQECMALMHSDFKRLLVIDYSFNMVNAFNNSEQFIQCICYALNIAVQTVINTLTTTDEKDEDGMQDQDMEDPYAFACFVSLIHQCRLLVLHFKEKKLQSSLPKNLLMCSSTCWKSVLSMLESINSQWEHIKDILIDRDELESFCIDQELLSLVVDFLEIFRDGYNELSSLTNPTLNLVLPWVTKWKTHCLQNADESPFLAAAKSFMNFSIDNEVVKRITIHHKLATMLDPRFKELQFLTPEDRLETQNHAEILVRECYETLLMNGIDVHNVASSGEGFPDLCDTMSAENESMNISFSEEVEEYLAEPFTMGKLDLDKENKFNPLQYWIRAKTKFPYLSRVALWILSCPASAIQTDDSFVASEWMVTMKETELPRKHMHKCLFVKTFRNFLQK
ncbi:transposable element Hobo transposase [Parasteatoda tepidariorum]|uniref:transposable element Hobo transposase n=1 Tax=Parasteatoda tepidariorum TaxID=114398 RepID=UPI00077FDFCE|nr:zinc finger BED domain-containing protein 4 [Parasteatoda tepidariorum]XP_015914978.1 zinc finger BED domain-containing protein 4 [Parasteatoda tepidariorum]